MIKPRARESLESGGDGAHSGTRAKAFSNAVALTTPASPHASNDKKIHFPWRNRHRIDGIPRTKIILYPLHSLVPPAPESSVLSVRFHTDC